MSRPFARDYRAQFRSEGGGLVVILSGWPRVSETFAANELRALHDRGLLSAVFATKPDDATLVQPAARELDDLVQVLDFDPDPAVQAAQIVERLRPLNGAVEVKAVHGYFAHHPTDVAIRVAETLGVDFGFSVHALDARKVSARELADRCARARLVVTCNEDAAEVIRSAGGAPVLLRHGVSLDEFAFVPAVGSPCAGDSSAIRLLAVGRLVEKKGFIHLLRALTFLPSTITLRIVGDGPESRALRAATDDLGLDGRVEFAGRRTHDELPGEYAAADIVVVPSVIASNGDRDGLPNVVLEAMATGRPIVAARTAAIPAAIRDDETGLLVEPGDPQQLAAAIARLAQDAEHRFLLGKAARAEAERRFSLIRCSGEFARLLTERYGLDGSEEDPT